MPHTVDQIMALEARSTELRRATAVQPGDVIAFAWAKGYPDKVVSVNMTAKGRVTIRFANSRSTVQPYELVHSFDEEDLA